MTQISDRKQLRIDLHAHTNLSIDGRSAKESLAKAAALRGLDAIVITDHDACALEAPERHGNVWLLPGCEWSTDAGHILGLFLDKPPDFKALRLNGLTPASDAAAMLHECGAVTVLAHPFIRKDSQPKTPVDCIECANARVYFKNPCANDQAKELAESLGLPQTGGSDAHSAGEIGNAYTVIDAPDCSLPALREALLNGRCHPVYVKNTLRRHKGLSQFRMALSTRKPRRIVKGIAYIVYCVLLDIFKR